ncbi:MAG: hypothetical protein JOS17DRAFT_554204 [Linnemannia elongata]|nr:MAG: hypothetical protein JOS17DRAFT_554204 [Linnemannia elongata]
MMRVVSIMGFMMYRRLRNCGLLVMVLLMMFMVIVMFVVLMVFMFVLVMFVLVLLLMTMMMMMVIMVAILMLLVVPMVVMLMVTILAVFVVSMMHMMFVLVVLLLVMMLMILVVFMVLVVLLVMVLMMVVLFVEPLYPIAQTGGDWGLPLVGMSFLWGLLGLVLMVVCLEPPVVVRPLFGLQFMGLSVKTDMVPLTYGWQVVAMYHIVDIRGLTPGLITKKSCTVVNLAVPLPSLSRLLA